ncbi:MAG: peptidoglycan-binding protein [Pseudomonadota bacterium]
MVQGAGAFGAQIGPAGAGQAAQRLFAGQSGALTRIKTALASGHHLICLNGAAGIGKSLVASALVDTPPPGFDVLHHGFWWRGTDVAGHFEGAIAARLAAPSGGETAALLLICDAADSLDDATLGRFATFLREQDGEAGPALYGLVIGGPEMAQRLRALAPEVGPDATIDLSPMTREESDAFVHGRVAGRGLPGGLTAQRLQDLYEATGGNPRRLKALVEKSLLQGASATSTTAPTVAPPTVAPPNAAPAPPLPVSLAAPTPPVAAQNGTTPAAAAPSEAEADPQRLPGYLASRPRARASAKDAPDLSARAPLFATDEDATVVLPKGPRLTAHPSHSTRPAVARSAPPARSRRVWRNLAASTAALCLLAGGAYVGVTVAGPAAQQTPELAAGGYILRAEIAAAPAPSPNTVQAVPTPLVSAPASPAPKPQEGVAVDPADRPVEPTEAQPTEVEPKETVQTVMSPPDRTTETARETGPELAPVQKTEDAVAPAPVLANPKPGAKEERRKTLATAKLNDERPSARVKAQQSPHSPAASPVDPAVADVPAPVEAPGGVEPARSLAGMPLAADNWSVAEAPEPARSSPSAPLSATPETTAMTSPRDPSDSPAARAVPPAPAPIATTASDDPRATPLAATPLVATPTPVTAGDLVAQIEPRPSADGWLPSTPKVPEAVALNLTGEPVLAQPSRSEAELPPQAALPAPPWMDGLEHHAKLLGQPAERAAMSQGVELLEGLLDSGLSGQIVTPRAQPVPVVIRRAGARIFFNHALSRCGGVLEPIAAQPDGVIFRERPYPNGGCEAAGWVRLSPLQDSGALYAWAETPAGPWTTTAHLSRDETVANRLHHAWPAPPDYSDIDPERQEALLALVRNDRKEIQRRLRLAGFDPKGVDGLFGPATRTAITEWQTARGFEATGYLNAAQKARLEDETNDRYVPPTPRIATRTERLWSSIRQSTRSIGPSSCRRDQNGRPVRGYETRCAAEGKSPSADR